MHSKLIYLVITVLGLAALNACHRPEKKEPTMDLTRIQKNVDDIMNREESFTFTEKHLRMIRDMAVMWDASESGAPIVQLYGPTEPYKKLASEIGIDISIEDLENGNAKSEELFKNIGNAFEIFIAFAELKLDTYTSPNRFKDLAGEYTEYQLDSNSKRMLPIPQQQEITFKFTHEHMLLLKHANARWLRYWQSPGINIKRPYGDRTYFQWDMADILNIPYDLDSKGIAILSQKQLDRLNKLHEEMLPTLQTFLIHAQLKPGSYTRKPAGFGVWRHVEHTIEK